ncbi:hypothetical protein N7541_002978 [Penicillium brevicompactum]|uniref:glucan 1,3-beta-glucosidase n=1 Tax=Penicillium brevicompactum TaxID=5074 RepID=A0A9W9RNI3_PENBR|nr:hypothetical protein N7541_002978 [Penicillium brevicompactum]
MPSQSRDRDRRDRRDRDRTRDHERARRRDRDYEREREYIRGRYEEVEGTSSPSNERSAKYRFRGESGYDSHSQTERDEYDEERERRRERRRRRREEDLAYGSPVSERRRERGSSRAKESPATSPRKSARDRDGYRRRDETGSPVRERRNRDADVDAETEARRRRRRERERERERQREREIDAAADVPARKHRSTESSSSASHLLSVDAMARLAAEHEDNDRRERSRDAHDEEESRRERRRQRKLAALDDAGSPALGADVAEGRSRHKAGARVVSGAYLEEGHSSDTRVRRRGGGGPAMEDHWKEEDSWEGSYDSRGGPPAWKFWSNWSKRKRIILGGLLLLVIVLAIAIPVGLVVSKKKDTDSGSGSSGSSDSDDALTSNLDSISRDSIPSYAKGTVLDPFTWYETNGFNVTFTNATVGGLSLMGLNSTWDDSTRPNDNVPPLNKAFPYGTQPIRGVNIGGWLSIEPFITPSLFKKWSSSDGIIDEYTLTKKLGNSAKSTIEKHYAEFITESDFAEIKEAGLDHVRIQYSYWAITTYDDDPYVAKIAWRYLLRAIEWSRKNGLRVKLDLHGLPGSQNGWNHSGRQGSINWLNGSDGELNRKRSLEIHDQLSQFFAQDRYKNVVTIYGLVNEPLMLSLPAEKVLNWTQEAAELVRKNGVNATLVLHDGFLNLDKWDNMYKTHPDNMYLDTHQYTTFNTGEIVLNHTAKVEIICNNWYTMIQEINVTSSGWGPTMCGEWSQADTDCAQYVNNVGRGTRWEGTYDTKDSTAYCPTADDGTCSCAKTQVDPSEYSDTYKSFLQTYAEAQMSAFETAMGWFYWTWRTESAAQWSYRTAWKNGFMPKKAYSPSFKCGDTVPDFSGMPEYY